MCDNFLTFVIFLRNVSDLFSQMGKIWIASLNVKTRVSLLYALLGQKTVIYLGGPQWHPISKCWSNTQHLKRSNKYIVRLFLQTPNCTNSFWSKKGCFRMSTNTWLCSRVFLCVFSVSKALILKVFGWDLRVISVVLTS